MKILLVQSYLGRKEDFPIFPLGLCYIATAASDRGHEVKIFDPNVASRQYEDLRKVASDFSPDVVGISLRNIDDQRRISPFYFYQAFKRTLKVIKETCDNVKIVVGGTGFSMFAEKVMERNPLIDYGIYLEGEESFQELLGNLDNPESVRGIYFRKEGNVTFSGYRELPDFKKQSIPRRDFHDIRPYLDNIQSIGIQTKRGCPCKCSYCNYPHLNGDKIRVRDVKSVCDEIEYLQKLNVKHFIFADAIFNMPMEHAKNICNEVINRGLNIQWSAYMDIKYATKEFLLLAMKAGCRDVVFSPDGLSQNALDGLKKGLKEKDVRDSFDLLTSDRDLKKLTAVYSIFINPPGETVIGILKTMIFYFKAKLLLRGRGNVFINWIRLEPETEALRIAMDNGVVPEDIDLLPDDEKDLKKTFYSNPSLKYMDSIIMAMLKSIPLLKSLLKK